MATTQARNEQLTQVGPDTPMGDLLRRYWHPIAGITEFDEVRVKPVRLMGEDLVLYKDFSGNYGLLDRHCPHRRADLSYGFVEECGLRCNYHGWRYDHTGQCIEQPYEDTAHPEVNLKAQVKAKAYPVQALGGLLFAYMGPLPAPLLPDWEFLNRTDGFRQIVRSDIPCNWLQCQENSIDPVHFEWMHANWSTRLAGKTGPYAPTHTKVDFREFEYGFTYNRIRTDTNDQDPLWTVGRVLLWPNGFFLGDHCEWRVPVDDENTLSICWFYSHVPSDPPYAGQPDVPTWTAPIKDEKTGRWISSHVINQDTIAWVGQGAIADRTKEFLGSSDRGVVMLRRQLLADIDAIKEGRDPKGTVRDPARNRLIALPNANRRNASPDRTPPREFPFYAHQPEEIRRAYNEAMGFPLAAE